MEMPNIIHPKSFKVDDMYFQVVSYSALTDSQASSIAINFYKIHKFKKKDKGKLFKIVTTFDESSANLL